MKSKKTNLFLDYAGTGDFYSDGDAEDEIIKILQSKDWLKKIRHALKENPNWPIRYHFSPERKNILDWYDFNPAGSLLEIGAGCGALTGFFCRKLKRVIAIELSKRRSEIIAVRHKNKKNLKIYVGNLNNVEIKEKFDYITLIGVLEYAEKFTHTNNPFVDFLIKAGSFLKKDGTLIIAIENKFGLKYWAGVREDHTGKFFDSIENYPKDYGVRTFSKKEIIDIILKAGFSSFDFYYPMPDYKLPTEIFSDKYLPTLNHNLRLGMFPVSDFSNQREFLFNEKLVMDNIIKNKQYDFFTNSFLIFLRK